MSYVNKGVGDLLNEEKAKVARLEAERDKLAQLVRECPSCSVLATISSMREKADL